MKLTKSIFSQYKVLIALIFLVIVAATGFTQVNQDEMRDLPPVVFINYVGTHDKLDTREEIRQIGVGLGRLIPANQRAGANNRYFVIHSVTDGEDNKLNADIFGLGVDAGVDHIRNLRVILQGYLQQAYNYSAADALLLAEFITIYNAVYRGNWDFISSRYKTPVINNLVRERTGLSIRYDEWPGRTLMLIPLGTGLGAIDTSAITDSRVIEEMRKDDDQGVPQRQQIVEMIEKQATQAEQTARTQREESRQEQRQVQQERQQVQEERQQVQEAYKAGRLTEEQAIAAQEDLARREQELARRAEAAEKKAEDADALDKKAEEAYEETQRLREGIADDQESSLARQQDGTSAGIIGITIESRNPTAVGTIILFDSVTGEEKSRFVNDLLHVRSVTFVGPKLFAILGDNQGSKNAVRLIEIDPSNVNSAPKNWADDDIKPGSLLWVNGSNLYAISIDLQNNKYYLSRFDTNLEMQARSELEVHQDASVAFYQGNLLTQRKDGKALILNPTDLKEVIIKQGQTRTGG